MVILLNQLVMFLLMKLILSITWSSCNGANIFCIYPIASFSHQQPQLALSHALAAKGHNLTVITANPSKVPIMNHRDIDMSYLHEIFNSKSVKKDTGFSTQKKSTGFDIIKAFPNMMDFALSKIYDSPQIQNLIREVRGIKYDLIIYDQFTANSLLGFTDLIGNPPIIGISTHHLPTYGNMLGNPTIPSYIPSLYFPISDHMTFWERLKNLYFEMYTNYIMEWYVRPIQEKYMHENFGNVNRKIHEFENNQSLLIVSTDLATTYAKPLQPNTVHVGPMQLQKELDPLPEDVKKWMDESEEGVIYFSLGSKVKDTSVPEHIRAAFIEAFKQFPKVRVLWKWESDEKLADQPDNVLVKNWLPQQPILAHPKVKIFISQIGLRSFEEAIYYGIPILGIPMFSDQDFNAKKLVTAGAGLSVEFQLITYDIIYEKLKDLLTNKSYKENMLHLSSITKDTILPPIDTAVWWVEYVLRHNGAPHLRPAALDLTWYQYYMLDILLLISVLISMMAAVAGLIIKKFMKWYSSSKSMTLIFLLNDKLLRKRKRIDKTV